MKLTTLIIFSILISTCNNKTNEKSTKLKKTDSTLMSDKKTDKVELLGDSVKQVTIGYYDTFEKLPKLVFDTISEVEFNALTSKISLIKVKAEQKGDYFFIKTKYAKHKFKKYKNYGGNERWSGNELMGYYPTLKLFAITENSTSESLGFGGLFLLDSLTDYKYDIVSFGDGSVELPIPSINNKFLVYYYNSVYEHKNSDIGILKINDKTNLKEYLTEYASYNSTHFAIEKILWKSDNCFYIKGYEKIYENEKWTKKYKYYKTTFN